MGSYTIQPELTNCCNYNCLYCPQSVMTRRRGFMSEELFSLCIKEARQHARALVFGFFGEQMLHPNFEEFAVRAAYNKVYRLILNTNWSLVTTDSYNALCQFDSVKISLDASEADLYTQLCPGPMPYEELVESIKRWLSTANRPNTELIYVVSSKNKADRQKFIAHWRGHLRTGDAIITKSVLTYGGKIHDSEIKRLACPTPGQKRLTIAWNGDCSPCNLDTDMELKVGNLLKIGSIKALIESSEWTTMLEAMKRRQCVPCNTCVDAQNHGAVMVKG